MDKQRLFFKVDGIVFAADQIATIDFNDIAELKATVVLTDQRCLIAHDVEALELAMGTKPSVLEGRRLRWAKNRWCAHNLIGHPLMQLLAWLRCYKAAIWVHDATVPRPLGRK